MLDHFASCRSSNLDSFGVRWRPKLGPGPVLAAELRWGVSNFLQFRLLFGLDFTVLFNPSASKQGSGQGNDQRNVDKMQLW